MKKPKIRIPIPRPGGPMNEEPDINKVLDEEMEEEVEEYMAERNLNRTKLGDN